MGSRAQILIEDTGIFLYTHWGSKTIVNDLKKWLKHVRPRWDDDEYFTRIIFSQMIKEDIDGETGYGIGISEHGDIERLISINIKRQVVTVVNNHTNNISKYASFDDFINGKEEVIRAYGQKRKSEFL